MSFRRRKSRIGPQFQAIIPDIFTIEEKQRLIKLYDYEQSLSEHCLTISSLSGPTQFQSISNSAPHEISNNSSSSSPPPTQSLIMNNPNNKKNSQNMDDNQNKYGIHDTSIDHRIDPICWDATKSHIPSNFDYPHYVNQYTIYPQQSLHQKMQKFQLHHTNKLHFILYITRKLLILYTINILHIDYIIQIYFEI